MANIEDYLIWRGDVPFNIDPFNEVDALVLCELVYSDFDGIVPGPGLKEKISIEAARELFFSKYTKEELLSKNTMTKFAPFLLDKMVGTKRFGGIKLAGFVNEIDDQNISQFSCCSFYLPDNTIFVAFRGTDDTLVGWREDFNMCFSEGTGGQLKAVEYLNKNFATTMLQIRVGGHSKGGNFAVYSSAFCETSIKDNLINVYNFDGPGFIKEIVETDNYKSIIKKTFKYIPEESIIGMLMLTKAKTTVVKSTQKGINQHDPLSWQVICNHFDTVPTVAASSQLIDEIITNWTVQFDYETRALFGEVFFESVFSSSGATNLSQLTSKKVKSIASLTKEIQSLEPDNQAVILDVFGKLLSVGGDSLKNTVLSKLPKNIIVRKKEK